jgi:hypothetical protein
MTRHESNHPFFVLLHLFINHHHHHHHTARYQHLVLETHKMENTIQLNLTEEEIEANESYKGQLQPEMTMATASLIAKIFKVLSETTVYVFCYTIVLASFLV